MNLIRYRLSHLGKIPLCNGIKRRALYLFGICFPLCYRCLAIMIALFVTLMITYKRKIQVSWVKCLIFLIPILIDGISQTIGLRESTNLLRVITGSLCGISLGCIITRLFLKIDN